MYAIPNELLLRIFHNYVDEEHSPVLLSHVCQLWRQLVLSTNSLWNIINLHSVRRAKHHLALARNQPLIVTWLYTRQAHPSLEDYEWIFSQASRFLTLGVVLPGPAIIELFSRLGNKLSQLQDLTVAGRHFFLSCKFGFMPSLRELSLSAITIDAPNLKDTLRGCPLLESLELSHITIMTYDLGPSIPVELPRLKSCTMAFLSLENQGHLTSFIVLPKQCTFHITIQGMNLYDHYDALHHNTLAMLEPIHISTIHLHAMSIEFVEDPQDSRCTFELSVGTGLRGEMPWDAIMSHGFSLDSVITLYIDSVKTLDGKYVLHVLGQILPRIRKLVVHQLQTLQDLLTSELGFELLSTASQLETLVLEGINLDSCSGAGLENVNAVCTFVRKMRSRKLLKLVLRDSETNREGLDMLHAVLPVECTRA